MFGLIFPLMAVPLFLEISVKMNAEQFFEIPRLSIWAGSKEKSSSLKKICLRAYLREYSRTSGFWPRVCARALRAPLFLGS